MTNEHMANEHMTNEVIQIRLYTTRDLELKFKASGIPGVHTLGGSTEIVESIHKFFLETKNVAFTEEPGVAIAIAAQVLQRAIFPDMLFEQLTAVLDSSGGVVKVIANDDLNQIPWELFTSSNSATAPNDYRCFWGYHHVFLRSPSEIRTGGHQEDQQLQNVPLQAGIVSFDEMPHVIEIQHHLEDLEENGIRLKGHFNPDSRFKAKSLDEVFKILKGLNIVHLSCLVVRFKYSDQAFLVFSDAFLLSLDDLEGSDLRFERSPLIFLDACDNTWHMMGERFQFLSALIKLRGGTVVTCFPPMPRNLALDFSKCFYEELASSELIAVPNALLNARRVLLKKHSAPLSLLFWLYGNPWSDVPGTSSAAHEIKKKEGILKMEEYIDFELHIAPDGHATVNSPEGQAIATVSIEVPNSIGLTLSLIERRQTDANLLRRLGQELYSWLFPADIHTHLQQTEAVARAKGAKIRLRLRIEAKEIASLPLEFTYRVVGSHFLATNPDTVLSRYLNLPRPPGYVRRREGPLHMLAIIADPIDQTRLPPDEWEAIIKNALAKPLANGQMTLQTVKWATRKEIRNALLQQKPDIIQFVGHGIYQNGKGYLALVNEQTSKTWLVDDESFANLYMGYDDHLGMISLATCESAKSDDPQGFLGIAPKLVERGVPAVLSMQYKVYVETAKIFLEDFYTYVAARKPIDWATQAARNAISQELGLDNREFATPVLYMRAKDGNIF